MYHNVQMVIYEIHFIEISSEEIKILIQFKLKKHVGK